MNSVGDFQEECLELSSTLNPILKKIVLLDQQERKKVIQANREMLLAFAESFVEMVSIFGYEEYFEKAAYIVELSGKIKEQQSSEVEVKRMLEYMIEITDKLIACKQGKSKTCLCCGEKVYYMPISQYYTQEEKYGVKTIPETLNKEEYTCPCCLSSDRDRLMVAFMKKLGLDEGKKRERLLQIAPSKAIEYWIKKECTAIDYESTDLYMDGVTFTSDVQNMSHVEDNSYDYIICSHVLEHVQDDKKAMRELKRILKSDGFCLFLVPIALDTTEIEEEWGLSEEENWKRFGQGDHCRRYSKDGLKERLSEIGFYVHEIGKEYLGADIFWECGLTDTSVLYVLTKQEGETKSLVEKRKREREKSMKNDSVYNEKEEKLVTVVMSAYNHENYVEQAIESVLNQTYQGFDFLVADDCSTDSTADKILKYEDKITQIHLFDQNSRAGDEFLADRLDFLFDLANTKYIALINSDDYWEEDKLKKQVEYMEQHPECGVCFTGVNQVDKVGNIKKGIAFSTENKSRWEWMNYLYFHGNCFAHPSMLIRTELQKKLSSERNDGLKQLPDMDKWIRLLQVSDIHVLEEPLTNFRWHDNNVSAPSKENLIRCVNEEYYIWLKEISKMDDDYFVKAFYDNLVNKDVTDAIDVKCEKFFLFMHGKNLYMQQAAINYFYEICMEKGVSNRLAQKYNFRRDDFFAIETKVGFAHLLGAVLVDDETN